MRLENSDKLSDVKELKWYYYKTEGTNSKNYFLTFKTLL